MDQEEAIFWEEMINDFFSGESVLLVEADSAACYRPVVKQDLILKASKHLSDYSTIVVHTNEGLKTDIGYVALVLDKQYNSVTLETITLIPPISREFGLRAFWRNYVMFNIHSHWESDKSEKAASWSDRALEYGSKIPLAFVQPRVKQPIKGLRSV
jgi:hypothetical protein